MEDSPIQLEAISQLRRAYFQQLLEATIILLIVFALAVIVAFAPQDMWVIQTQGRVILLSITCTWWVLSWLAIWKICVPNPDQPDMKLLNLRRFVRIVATGYLFVPFLLFGISPRDLDTVFGSIVFVPLLMSGFIAAFTCFLYMARCARRMGNRAVAAQLGFAGVVAAILLFIFVLLAPTDVGDPSSLGTMLDLAPAILPTQGVFVISTRLSILNHTIDWIAFFELGLMLWIVCLVGLFTLAARRSLCTDSAFPASVPLVSS